MNTGDCAKLVEIFEYAKISHDPMPQFEQLEQFLQAFYHFNFLKHHEHYYYVRKNPNFAHVSFDGHDRIDYRTLYISAKEHKHDAAKISNE